jgi:hypothetical protein
MVMLLFAACTATMAEEQPAGSPAEPAAAIWKTQELSFTYSSATSVYSCGALRSRVISILRAVGANEDLKVSVSSCQDFFAPPEFPTSRSRQISPLAGIGRGPAQLAFVRIRLRNPTPATPDAIAELEKSKGYRELLGRVTGSSEANQEAAAQFPALREQVLLNYRSLRLEPEECELLEQMIREVFPKLGVRVVENSMSCIPRQTTLIKPRVKVEAFIKLPPPDASTQEVPADQTEDTAGAEPAVPVEPTPPAAPVPASPSPAPSP